VSLKKFGLWKDLTFYFVLEAQADAVERASQVLGKLAESGEGAEANLTQLAEIREESDRLLHQFAGRLDSAFITPLDKEDLDAFSQTLDIVLGGIESAAFHCHQAAAHLDQHERGLAALVMKAGTHLHELAGLVRTSMKKHALEECLTAILTLKRTGDTRYRAAFTDLVSRTLDPRVMLLKKEACQQLDVILDRAATVATLARRLAIKYG
jgi:uncharacterized protein Yka (UPF0111/DUF47 family)